MQEREREVRNKERNRIQRDESRKTGREPEYKEEG